MCYNCVLLCLKPRDLKHVWRFKLNSSLNNKIPLKEYTQGKGDRKREGNGICVKWMKRWWCSGEGRKPERVVYGGYIGKCRGEEHKWEE